MDCDPFNPTCYLEVFVDSDNCFLEKNTYRTVNAEGNYKTTTIRLPDINVTDAHVQRLSNCEGKVFFSTTNVGQMGVGPHDVDVIIKDKDGVLIYSNTFSFNGTVSNFEIPDIISFTKCG